MLSAGIKLGPYEIQSAIGAGGMGEVYQALDNRLDRLVAIKILPPQFTLSAQALERFQREAKAVAALHHPNICAIYDVGEAPFPDNPSTGRNDGTIHFLVMELLEGETLQRRLARGSLDVVQVMDIGAALSDALAAAHSKGIMHRDIKPANVFLTAHGPKLLDFGLAKTVPPHSGAVPDSQLTTRADESMLTNSGSAMGTVAYMSPEQVRGVELDTRSDIFSLGLVLYEMAAGKPTFSAGTIMGIAASILHEQPKSPRQVRPELPAKLEELILKTIEKDREARIQTASELQSVLQRLRREVEYTSDSSATTPLLRYRTGLGVAVTVALLALAAGTYVMRKPTPPSTSAPAPAAVEPAKQAPPVPVAEKPAEAPAPAAAALDSPVRSLKAVRLTISGNADRPAISPDGKLIVYVQHGQGDSLWLRQTNQPRTANDILIMPAEPGVQILGATVTPDSTRVDYLRNNGGEVWELWRAPLFGGARKRIADHANSLVGWSADGHRMAFIRWDLKDAATSLIVADPDGNHEQVVAQRHEPAQFQLVFSRNGLGIQRPAWSRDGTSIALIGTGASSGGRHVVIVNVAQKSERVMPVEGGAVRSLAWLDAGTLLLNRPTTDTTTMQLWRMSYPDGKLSQATFDDLTGFNGGLSVTADGSQIVTAERTPRAALWIGDGRAMEGKEFVAPELGLDRGWAGGLSMTWMGDKLVYPSGVTIFRVDPGRGSLEELITNGRSPASTTDGRTLIYVSPARDKSGLWKADADGRHAVQLVAGNVNEPVVTPDNRQVIFNSNRGGQFSLWTVPLTGGMPAILVAGPASVPTVSPNGKSLMFGKIDDQHPGGVMAICELPVCSSSEYVSPAPPGAWSFLRWTPEMNAYAYINQPNIWIQPLDGTPPYALTHFSDGRTSDFAWSHDGKRLAIARLTEVKTDIILFKSD